MDGDCLCTNVASSVETPAGSTINLGQNGAKITVEIMNLTLTLEGPEHFVKREFECFIFQNIIKPNIDKVNIVVSKSPNAAPDAKAEGWV